MSRSPFFYILLKSHISIQDEKMTWEITPWPDMEARINQFIAPTSPFRCLTIYLQNIQSFKAHFPRLLASKQTLKDALNQFSKLSNAVSRQARIRGGQTEICIKLLRTRRCSDTPLLKFQQAFRIAKWWERFQCTDSPVQDWLDWRLMLSIQSFRVATHRDTACLVHRVYCLWS